MKYEWDDTKDQANKEKHDVTFSVVEGLDWDTVLEAQDIREQDEVRMIAFDSIGDRLYWLVYTMRGQKCRVISLRKANGREIRGYEEA
ncbi:MAG: uncharacterized DUF497 family protein [Halioglobus sp.]|jgi:uncharacterized DUF497 family protein